MHATFELAENANNTLKNSIRHAAPHCCCHWFMQLMEVNPPSLLHDSNNYPKLYAEIVQARPNSNQSLIPAPCVHYGETLDVICCVCCTFCVCIKVCCTQ